MNTSTKLIMFRLLQDARYRLRYDSLVAAVSQISETRFDEPTSAVFMTHPDNVDVIFERLLRSSELYHDGSDMLMVMDLVTHQVKQMGLHNPRMLEFVLACGRPRPLPVAKSLGSVMKPPSSRNALMRPGRT